MSDIRFNQWLHNSGTGGVSQVDGGHVGIGTTNPLIPVGSGNTSILNVGVVTANSYYGSGANLTSLPAQATIANNADNRVITGGSGVNLNGEANLTWDGTTLLANKASGAGHIAVKGGTSGGDYGIVQVQSGSTVRGRLVSDASVDVFRIDTAGGSNTPITFLTGSSYTERVRINEHGLSIKNSTNTSALCVNNVRGTASAPSFNEANSDGFLVDVYNTGNPYPRYVSLAAKGYGSTTADMSFWTDSGSSVVERLRITSGGKIGIGHHTATQINSELTIRPANDGGILIGRPGDTVAPINKALTITTTTTGSEAYHTKYHTYNCNSIFATYEGGGTGGNFIFKTGVGNGNETERLRIHSTGQVTKPAQPCASMTIDSSTISGSYMSHSSVHTNIGNHYNTGTSIFTCPVAGLYYVSIMVMSNNNDQTMDLEFHINGSNSNNILVPYSAGTGGSYNQVVGSTIVSCPANAQLRFKLNSGSIYGGRHSNMTFALFA